MNNPEHNFTWKMLFKTNFSLSSTFLVPDKPEFCWRCCAVLPLAGNKGLQKWNHGYSSAEGPTRPVVQHIIDPFN